MCSIDHCDVTRVREKKLPGGLRVGRTRRHRRHRAVIFHSLASHLVCAIVVLDEQLSQFHSAPRTATRTWCARARARANLVQVN